MGPYQNVERRSLKQERRVQKSFIEANAFQIIDESVFFSDVDLALEYCEAQILGDLDVSKVKLLDVFTLDIDLFAGFTVDQINSIRPFFTRETYEKGDLLMREGAAGIRQYCLKVGLLISPLAQPGLKENGELVLYLAEHLQVKPLYSMASLVQSILKLYKMSLATSLVFLILR